MPRKLVALVLSTICFLTFVSIIALWCEPRTGGVGLPLPRNDLMEKTAPGIGFDLTASYGTAAIRHDDGSVETVAKIEADAEYHPPYNNLGESFQDEPRQLWQTLRRSIGLPATADVGTLSRLLISLRTKTEEKLGHSIHSAVLATPHLVALYEEDIVNILDYAGLSSLDIRYAHRQPHELSAAYAGNSLGLCQDYTNSAACEGQERCLPVERVLSVLYTKTALTVSLSIMTHAYEPYDPDDHCLIDWNLGSNAAPEHNANMHPEDYWERVRKRIQELPLKGFARRGFTKVLLLGESALDETFLGVLRDAIGDLQADMPEFVGDDPLFIAAKGAAEFAKRAPYTHESLGDEEL